MKIKMLSLLVLGLLMLSSCQKEEIDPTFEIYVTTKASEKWTSVEYAVSNVRIANLTESGEQGWAGLSKYSGSRFNVNLQNDQSILVYNDRHFDLEMLGLKLDLNQVTLINGDAVLSGVNVPYYDYGALDEVVSIENGKTYKIDFIIDFDELIYEENGNTYLDTNYGIEVTEL